MSSLDLHILLIFIDTYDVLNYITVFWGRGAHISQPSLKDYVADDDIDPPASTS